MIAVRREERVYLHRTDTNTFQVTSKDGVTYRDADEDYFIYFKNVNLRANGDIDGRFLGYTTDTFIDDACLDVDYEDGVGYMADGRLVRTARMLAVDNKNNTIIVIENE